MDESDSCGGRKDIEIGLGMRFMERRREHDNTKNTVTFPTKENDFIYQKQHISSLTFVPFKR